LHSKRLLHKKSVACTINRNGEIDRAHLTNDAPTGQYRDKQGRHACNRSSDGSACRRVVSAERFGLDEACVSPPANKPTIELRVLILCSRSLISVFLLVLPAYFTNERKP